MTTTSVTQPEIVRQFFNESHFEGTVEELLTALEGPQKSPLTVATQAEVFALLWELDGHLRMLRKLVSDGHITRSTRSIRLAQRAVSDLFGAIPLTDNGMAAADKKIADPVWQARFEAIGATLVSQRGEWKEYTLPANQISLRNPSKLTDEQRQERAERARKTFAAR